MGPKCIKARKRSSENGKNYKLSEYPNPFCPNTTISYVIPDTCEVQIVVYNVEGKMVDTLINQIQLPGVHSIVWDAKDVTSGIYFYKVNACGKTETKKMVLLK
ncbi:MAG: T9SS type A sorting domain-containing protein [candidate division Zixibacteria bacterium]|nr:T9SS type A sorting domain-containing protein [candidate division Zixibacteria bacterium]